MDLNKAKIDQAIEILNELDIDLWLIFCRETDMMADPALDLVVGHAVVWQSAFLICKNGDNFAMVGNYDASDFEQSGRFKKVIPYVEDCGKEIKNLIKKINPNKIALNYSVDDTAADGLSHGMYLMLCDYLKGTDFPNRFISSENLMSLLRGRKTDEEIKLVSKAANIATECWDKTLKEIKPGLSAILPGWVSSTHSMQLLTPEPKQVRGMVIQRLRYWNRAICYISILAPYIIVTVPTFRGWLISNEITNNIRRKN